MSTLLAQIVASLESTNRLRSELATKAAVLHESATLLRTGSAPDAVAAVLVKELRALHGLGQEDQETLR